MSEVGSSQQHRGTSSSDGGGGGEDPAPASGRRPLHVPVPPKFLPPPIAAHLDRANASLRVRVGSLAAARQRREEVTKRAFAARTERMHDRVSTAESASRKQAQYLQALEEWKHSTASARHERHAATVHSSLRRHQELSQQGEAFVAAKREEIGVAPPPTPRRTATGARDERLLAPLEKAHGLRELRERMELKMYLFEASKARMEDVRATTAERKIEARAEREALARQRAEEQVRQSQATHVANTIRSELALQRAARRKARVRDPRRALAEDRLALREAAREERRQQELMMSPRARAAATADGPPTSASATSNDATTAKSARKRAEEDEDADPFPPAPARDDDDGTRRPASNDCEAAAEKDGAVSDP